VDGRQDFSENRPKPRSSEMVASFFNSSTERQHIYMSDGNGGVVGFSGATKEKVISMLREHEARGRIRDLRVLC
jgi:hypothetical protein